MITVTCDMCGEKLNRADNQVDLSLEYEGIVTLGNGGFRSTRKQLCTTCATRLVNWIDNQLEERR
jgi:hypothetical protein